MNSKELRQNFIDYFLNKRSHSIVRSSSVVPNNDPTLLFTNAGMNQFKDIFIGEVDTKNKRVVNSQKCIRVSGKHNDLEEVGVDNYHHTFFEMLGNWSFGDYYKEEAITWAWDYLTEELKLDKTRLWVTVYKDDQESEELWKQVTDISHDRILKFGKKDNFWEMGETGPCGPCTEIHYYIGDNLSDQNRNGVNSEDLYREIWNLVFIQYNRVNNEELIELPVKHVDTGMGLERILSIFNGMKDHYETDLFKPIIQEIAILSSSKANEGDAIPHRVIADHLRMLSFSIADGAMPSNEGRGYVLRRVLRRASRYGRTLNFKEPFIFKLVDTLCTLMGDTYPELVEKKSHIKQVIKSEETSFLKTLDKGIMIFDKIISNLSKNQKISGSDAFKLYDTYGFPLDLTELLAKEKGLSVDLKEFDRQMDKQKEKARKSGKFISNEERVDWVVISKGGTSSFLGYDSLLLESKILKYRKFKDNYEYILNQTPFYAESGGQIGDIGEIYCDDYRLKIIDTIKIDQDIVHISEDFNKNLIKKNKVHCSVQSDRRNKIKANHTATHLLHAALKNILGNHVQQAGSLVSDDRLRFDLTHYEKISKNEILEIESMVNEKIRESIPLDIFNQEFEEAKKDGVIAMFDEKYGDEVRVVNIPDFSKELCGGTHVLNTSDISLFKIISESSLSTGVRRIEAITGETAVKYFLNLSELVSDAKNKMSCSEDEILDRLDNMQIELKSKNKELEKLNAVNENYKIKDLISKSHTYNGIELVISKEDKIVNIKDFGNRIIDTGKKNLITVIGSISNDKPMIMCAVSSDLHKRISAKTLISKLAVIIDGGGGGKDSVATAGGKDVAKLDEALNQSLEIIKKILDE